MISVNSKRSASPESTYDLIYFPFIETDFQTASERRNQQSSKLTEVSDGMDMRFNGEEIVITNCAKPSTLSVYDINGRLYSVISLDNSEAETHFTLSDLGITVKGIYIIRIENQIGSKVIKINV